MEGSTPLKGHLIFFQGESAFQVARGLESSRKGLRIEDRTGQRTIPDKDILATLSSPPSELEPALAAGEDILEKSAHLDLMTAWEFVLEEAMESTTVQDLLDLLGDASSPGDHVALLLALKRHQSPFRWKGERLVPMSRKAWNERQEQDQKERQKEGEKQGLKEAILAVGRGDLADPDSVPEAQRALDLLRSCLLDENPARLGLWLLDELAPGGEAPQARALGLLVSLGMLDPHVDVNLLRMGATPEFPQDVLDEIPSVLQTVQRLAARRKDISYLESFSIDDEETVEVDDALAVELRPGGCTVHVLICDVASAIPPGCRLDQEAGHRASTIYHPVDRIPMLPYELSANALSLREGVGRLVIDHQFQFDGQDQLFAYSAVPALISMRRRLTYDEADAILEDPSAPLHESLSTLARLATRMTATRVALGAIPFYPREGKVRVVDGVPSVSMFDTYSPSRRLVAEFMVETCARTGSSLFDSGVATIYRSQAAPDAPVNWSEDLARRPWFILQTIRQLKRAEVTLQPGTHAGLGVTHYTQITSPLRRYGDLLMQRQLVSFLERGVPAYSEGELLERLGGTESTLGQIRKASAEADRYWTLVALSQRVDQEVEVEVLSAGEGSALVLVLDFALTCRFYPRSAVAEGDRLFLKVARVAPREDRIVLKSN